MTNLEVLQGQRIYLASTKIDETFRDLKSLLGMLKLMNKQRRLWKRCWYCCYKSLPLAS
jgi:hypothetical protein